MHCNRLYSASLTLALLGTLAAPAAAQNCPDPVLERGPIPPGRWHIVSESAHRQIDEEEFKFEPTSWLGGEFDQTLWSVEGTLTYGRIGGPENNFIDINEQGVISGMGQDRIVVDVHKEYITSAICGPMIYDGFNAADPPPEEDLEVTINRSYFIQGQVHSPGIMEVQFVYTGGSVVGTSLLEPYIECGMTRIDGQPVVELAGGHTIAGPGGHDSMLWSGSYDGMSTTMNLSGYINDTLGKVVRIMRNTYLGHTEFGNFDYQAPLLDDFHYETDVQFMLGNPIITDVQVACPGTFLEGVQATAQVTATVNWGSGEGGRIVEFSHAGTTQTVVATGNTATFDINVGAADPNVTVKAWTGSRPSGEVTYPLPRIPVPAWLGSPSFSASGCVNYETELAWPVNTSASRIVDTVSLLSGFWGLTGSAESALTIQAHADGTPGQGALDTDLGIELAGRTFGLKIDGENQTVLDCNGMTMNGDGTIPILDARWEQSFNPITLIPGAATAMCNFHRVLCSIVRGLGVTASAGVDIDGVVTYEGLEDQLRFTTGSIDGEIEARVALSITPPPLDKVIKVLIQGGGRGCITFQAAPSPELTELGAILDVSAEARIVGLLFGPVEKQWPFGDDCFNDPSTKAIGPMLATNPTSGMVPSERQANVILGPGGRAAAVWSGERVGAGEASGDLYVQMYDGSNWGVWVALTDDDEADHAPTAAFDGDGNLVIVHQRNPNLPVATDIAELQSFASGFELAYAVIGPTGQTVDSGMLTSNSVFDFGAQLRTDDSGNVHVFWQRTGDPDFVGSANEPVSIHLASWDGTEFGAEETVADGLIAAFGWHPAVHDGNEMLVGLVRDLNENLDDADDREIFAIRKTAGTWAAPVRLTSNAVGDEGVLAVFLPDGSPAICWRAEEAVLGVTGDLTMPAQTWIAAGVGPGLAAGRMLSNSSGLALIWPEADDLRYAHNLLLPANSWTGPEVVVDTPYSEQVFDADLSNGGDLTYAGTSRAFTPDLRRLEDQESLVLDTFSLGSAGDGSVCQLDFTQLDFGRIPPGGSSVRTFTIMSVGTEPLSGEVVETCDEFVILQGEGPYKLIPGDSTTVMVEYRPSGLGDHSCTLSTGGCADVQLSGEVDPGLPAVVVDYSARWQSEAVEIVWTLDGFSGEAQFTILRGTGGELRPLTDVELEQNETRFLVRDRDVRSGEVYDYRVLILESGQAVGSFDVRVAVPLRQLSLQQNVPNPFNPRTEISFQLRREGPARLWVFDLAGRLVKTLVDEHLAGGLHSIEWDGRDESGRTVASGSYFYRLESEDGGVTRKMLLLK